MYIPTSIINEQPAIVQELFNYWSNYMNQHVHFSLSDSHIHSKAHCERVLMNALLIGHRIFGDSKEELSYLAHASIFHDSCRWDDCSDVGHGARAAEYYSSFCKENLIEFSKEAYYCIKYHDRDDELGIKSINMHLNGKAAQTIVLYSIFKDADALDRFRFGVKGVNKRFIRNKESFEILKTAFDLVMYTITDTEI